MTECNFSTKIMGKKCEEHYGHGDFRLAFWFVFVAIIAGLVSTYFIAGGLEEREIMHEKINVMTCPELTKLLSESNSRADLHRAEQNYKWECTENKLLELEP